MAVEFDDQIQSRVIPKARGLSARVISWGLAKNEKEAQIVLLGIAIVAALIAVFFMFSNGSSSGDANFVVSPNETVGSEQGLPPQ